MASSSGGFDVHEDHFSKSFQLQTWDCHSWNTAKQALGKAGGFWWKSDAPPARVLLLAIFLALLVVGVLFQKPLSPSTRVIWPLLGSGPHRRHVMDAPRALAPPSPRCLQSSSASYRVRSVYRSLTESRVGGVSVLRGSECPWALLCSGGECRG